MPPTPPPVAEIDAVSAIANPVLRNLRITVAYGHLANAFHEQMPGAANWCTFATWASKQAGCTIRREDFSRAVGRHFRSRLDKRAMGRQLSRMPGLSAEVLAALVAQVSLALPGVGRAADAVARGNLKVFEEIGRGFACVLEGGRPPDDADLLQRAFVNYQTAISASDPTVRAQAAFLANVQIGLHEQRRLQPEIREAMDAALLDMADVRREILERLETVVAGPVHNGLLKDAVNGLVDDLAQEVRSVVHVVITELMMTIGLPRGRTLRLGSDVSQRFPATLKSLVNVELASLVGSFDPAPDSTHGSGAIDWSVLEHRMRFIADFFRSSHDDDSLHEAPFPRPVLDTIAAGRTPVLTGIA
jgi:hypothetical protein